MVAIDHPQSIPLNLRFTKLQMASPVSPPATRPNNLSRSNNIRSIFDAVQPDAVFIQDMSQGLADTSWERQEASAWVSDEEDSLHIEAHLQTARLCSTMKRLSVGENELINNSSPSSSLDSKSFSSPVVSEGGLNPTSVPPISLENRASTKGSSQALVELLKSADLDCWIDKFLEQDIEIDSVEDLTDNDLIGLGMVKIGTRRKFQRIVREWLKSKSSD